MALLLIETRLMFGNGRTGVEGVVYKVPSDTC